MKSYETSNPIPFLQTVKYNVLHAWHEYISTTCGATTVHSDKVYALIRKTAGIYYSLSNASDEERITAVCNQTKLSEDKAKEYIRYAEQFRFSLSLDFEPDDIDELLPDTITENRLSENNPSAEEEFFHLLRKEIIANTAEKLKTQELQILSLTSGVCPFCLRFIPQSERKTYEELALLQGISGGDVIEKKRKRILKKYAEALKNEGF